MDGSRRFSKVYSKTESGADALTSARGVLSSSARQLLILVDGQRDLRELSGIFGEEALNRLLPQLESQGLVRDLNEPPESGEPPEPSVPPSRSETPVRTVMPGPASELRSLAVSQQAPEPAPILSKPPKRYLAVPIAIAASLLTALALVYWIFAREQNLAENPPVVAASPSAPPPADVGRRPPSTNPTVDPPLAITAHKPEASDAPPLPVAPDPLQAPTQSNALPAPESKPPAPALPARPAEANPRKSDARKTTPESSAVVASAAPAKPTGSLAIATPAQAAAADLGAVGPIDPRPGPAPVLHERSRVLPTISKRAQRSGIYAGSAVVRLHVNSAGAVERVELVSASPPQVYDQDVERALEQWTFDPPGNSAVMTVELDFRPQSISPPAANTKPADPP